MFTSWAVEARPPHSVLHCCSTGLPGASPQTGHSCPWVWGLEHLGLGAVPPSTAQMLRLLSCWVMALFSPSILFPTFWFPKRISVL